MARGRDDAVAGTPSTQQAAGLLIDWLQAHGRLTMPQAARLCCNQMLGDFNLLGRKERAYWMAKAQRVLENLSRVLPIYCLSWRQYDNAPAVRVWYYSGKEPGTKLRKDLRRPGCDAV